MSAMSPRDPGLQPERTYLSWQRTLILLLVVSVLSSAGLTDATPAASPVLAALPLLLAAGAAFVISIAVRKRWRTAAPEPPELTRVRPWQVMTLSAVVAGLAILISVTALW